MKLDIPSLELAARLGWAVIHSLWQGALIAVLLVLGLHALRSASARNLACLAASVAMLASFGWTLFHHRDAAPALADSAPARVVTAPESGAPAIAPVAISEEAPLRSEPRGSGFENSSVPASNENASLPQRPPWREQLANWAPAIGGVWLLGFALLSLWRVAGWQRVRSLRRDGTRAASAEIQRLAEAIAHRLGLRVGTQIFESTRAAVPMLIGVLKPAILLPAQVATGLGAHEIEALIAHELAHLARGDVWTNLLGLLAETIFFYHPVAWWIARQTAREREHAADDLALRVCAARDTYAAALAHLAELAAPPAPALAATGGSLVERIRRILGKPPHTDATAGLWAGAAALVGLALLAAHVLPAQAAEDTIRNAPATSDAVPQPEVQKTEEKVPSAPEDAPASSNDPAPAEKTAAQWADDAKAWVADAFQLDDAAKRQAAIERIRQAIASSDVNEARTGITAFGQLGPIEFDKASFRPAVRALLKSSDAATRGAAATAFIMTGADPEDLPRIFALADDPAPEVRDRLTIVIAQLMKRDLTDKAASEAILKLMDKLPRDPRDVAHSLWGSKFSPEIEARVLEFTRDIPGASNSSPGYTFFYGALSTQANKSEASCKRLIELLAHEDTTNIAGRSAWGLQQGVDRAQFPLVADAMVKVIEARSDGYLRNNALRCLRTYGDAAQAPAITALLAKPGMTGEFQKLLAETLAALEKRPVAATEATPSTTETRPAKTAATEEAAGLREKVGTLEKRLAEVEEQKSAEARAAQLVDRNRQAARLRAAEDRRNYTPEQLQEIETLYQVANTKGKRSEEAKASLKELLEKYDKANRTGCATLYLGQASEGAERLEYLTRAVEKFSDCYYFNGCQVGGYGRYVLALTLWEKGEKENARALLAELKTTYKDATDHRGKPMGEIAEAVEKELETRQ